MNAVMAIAATVAACALAGCTPAPLTKADVDGKIVCNSDRMDQVERAVRRANWHVQWVHCPPAVLRAV